MTAGGILAVLVGAFVLLAVVIGTGNWEVQPILSGSMRPGFPVGGVVVAQRVPTSSLQVRDVILFHPPGEPTRTYVHRIISLKREGGTDVIRTKGDDNPVPDPWTLHLDGRWAYEARYTVPFVGYLAVWDHSGTGRQDLLLTAGALIVICGALVMGGEVLAYRRRRAHDGTAMPSAPSDVRRRVRGRSTARHAPGRPTTRTRPRDAAHGTGRP
jgi:signal peptidase I